MIEIRAERCTGCGLCLDVCATGALYLVDGKVAVDETLCSECGACVLVCPAEALAVVQAENQLAMTPVRIPVSVKLPAPLAKQSVAGHTAVRIAVLPLLGAMLKWTGREVVPRVAGYLLDELDRRRNNASASNVDMTCASPRLVTPLSSGRQHRQRARRGKT